MLKLIKNNIKISFGIMLVILITISNVGTSIVNANTTDVPVNDKVEVEEIPGEAAEEIEECEIDEETGEFSSACFGADDHSDIDMKDFSGISYIAQSIFSSDEKINTAEKKKYHYKLYSVSYTVPNAIVTQNHKGVDVTTDFLLYIMVLISTGFEMIAHLFVLIDLLITKLVYGNFIYGIAQSILMAINNAIFQWDNPTGFGYVLTFSIIFFVIIRRTIRKWNEFEALEFFKNFVKMIFMGILVVNSFTYLYKPMVFLKENITNEIVQILNNNISDGTTTGFPEVDAKESVFITLELNPFLVSNFGYANIGEMKKDLESKDLDYEEMYGEDVFSEGEYDYDEIAELRIKHVIAGHEKHLNYEIDEYKNKYIVKDFSSASGVIMFSFISMIHTAIFVVVDIILKGLLLSVQIIEYATYIYIFIPLLNIIFKDSDKILSKFILDRLKWFMLFLSITISINILLYAYNMIVKYVLVHGILSLLILDITVVVAINIVYQNREIIFNFMKEVVSSSGEGGFVTSAVSKAKDIVKGDYTADEFISDAREIVTKIKSSNKSDDDNGDKNENADEENNIEDEIDEQNDVDEECFSSEEEIEKVISEMENNDVDMNLDDYITEENIDEEVKNEEFDNGDGDEGI